MRAYLIWCIHEYSNDGFMHLLEDVSDIYEMVCSCVYVCVDAFMHVLDVVFIHILDGVFICILAPVWLKLIGDIRE